MNMLFIRAIALLCSVSLVAAATAPDQGKPGCKKHGAKVFAKIDTNDDGKISLAEFTAGAEARRAKMKEKAGDRPKREGREGKERPSPDEVFSKLDKNEDGFLTKEELAARRHGKKCRKGKGKRQAPNGDA